MLQSLSNAKPDPESSSIQVGIIGLGTVGTGVAKILLQQTDLLTARTGLSIHLKAIAELDWGKKRNLNLDQVICTTDANKLLNHPEIDIIVETIGGCEAAYAFINKAIEKQKHIVTANKALLATRGRELFKKARAYGVNIYFEASVGGGIPIIKALREGLVANRFETIYGILNGTCNYILSQMDRNGRDFDQALKEAQEQGFAEADPTLDISGKDTAYKLSILASLASSGFVAVNEIFTEGIAGISKSDIDLAKELGYTTRLLAIYRNSPEGLDVRVHPTLIPNSHLLAAVHYESNAVFVKGDFVGETMYYGPGAGQDPTASAVVGDLVDLSRGIATNAFLPYHCAAPDFDRKQTVIPIAQIRSGYFLRFSYPQASAIEPMIGFLTDAGVRVTAKTISDRKNQFAVMTAEVSEATLDDVLKRAQQRHQCACLSKIRSK